jgi:GcrA cell cycle regulator
MTWTDARIALITRLWAEGVSASGIAEALGEVSRSAVLGKLHRLGLLGSRLAASAPRRYEGRTPAPPVRTPAAQSPPAPRASAPPTPPSSPWREAVFTPLAGSAPRVWLTREPGECAFPVGGEGEAIISCCAPTRAGSAYCAAHHAIVFKAVGPDARAAEARRWVAAAETWAA